MVDDTTKSESPKVSLAALGLASASAQAEEAEAALPRLLRYALVVEDGHRSACTMLVGEIVTLVPELEELATSWERDPVEYTKLFADALDTLSVSYDRPLLAALSDSVRLLGVTDEPRFVGEQRRVAAALAYSLKRIMWTLDEEMRVRLETVALGWALVASGTERSMSGPAYLAAKYYADARVTWIKQVLRVETERLQRAAEQEDNSALDDSVQQIAHDTEDLAPEGFVRVCLLAEAEIKQKKLKDVVVGHEHVLGCDVPLAPLPDLNVVRTALKFEFPYALGVIDTLLSDLVGRAFVYLKPTLIWGSPGSGKTHFCRRLADLLGAGAWRCDASTSDGAVIGGTARRWYSTECAHPFLAISRTRVANPLFLIDELEKSGTRSDYGRLWDSLLGFLEVESASRYPDPALQVEIDVSHVSYVATANSLEPLPAPLRDRMRILAFPEPRLTDLPMLMPSVLDQLARERGVDARWIQPLSQADIEIVSSYWRGGSVRRLKRYVDAILRDRDDKQSRQ